jgi:Ni/Co efflux regulator RcnB
MDKATHGEIVRAYEVDRGGNEGESGARECGEGGARAGAGGSQAASKDESAKRNTGEEEGSIGEEEDEEEEVEEEDETEGDEDRDAAPHGPRCMDPANSAIRNSFPALMNIFLPTQPGKQRPKIKAGRKKRKREEERGEQAEAVPRACKGHKAIKDSKRRELLPPLAGECFVRVRV